MKCIRRVFQDSTELTMVYLEEELKVGKEMDLSDLGRKKCWKIEG